MKICQVHLGLLPIPPNGWGAVEKIVWEYHCNLNNLGHQSFIKYLDEIKIGDYDLIHQHVANLALESKRRGFDYVFTLHDHHAFLYGKNSDVYKQNLEAIDKSVISFVPSKFLLSYFDNHPKLFYLEHGVNLEVFKYKDIDISQHKLLCVANNGFANDQGFDRKGFSYAINAAKILDLPITIAGPKNNEKFFNRFKQKYDKLNVTYDLTEEELVRTYQDHTIFLHPSILEAGQPNLTLLEAMACGLPVIGTLEPEGNLPGMTIVDRDVNQIVNAIQYVINNYQIEHEKCLETANKHSYENITKKLITIYKNKLNSMRSQLIDAYENTPISIQPNLEAKNTIYYTFINGPKVEIKGSKEERYKVQFINLGTNNIDYETEIGNNQWCKCSKEYFVNWHIKVFKNNELISEHIFDPAGKRVYISIDSSALGDTLAWIPFVEEFRKKYNAEVVLSTFNNHLFEGQYPEITFIKPGTPALDLYAMFTVGWFYSDGQINYAKTPINFRERNLQEASSAVLGLPFTEIRPKINIVNKNRNILENYIVIAPHASAHAKYWNYPGGWQKVIDHVNSLGYKVVMLTSEKLNHSWHDSKLGGTLINVVDKTGNIPLQDRITDIYNADLFIGLGSGLSWLSWALGTKTILISGFSEPYSEFSDCVRIYPKGENICKGCFNRHKLDPSDWEWCPEHKNTDRMFECTKTITPEEVISEINKALYVN